MGEMKQGGGGVDEGVRGEEKVRLKAVEKR